MKANVSICLLIALCLVLIGCTPKIDVSEIPDSRDSERIYWRICTNSLDAAKDQINASFKGTKIISATEEQNYFLIETYSQVQETISWESFHVPRCDYLEMISIDHATVEIEESQCNNQPLAILRANNTGKEGALNGVIFYWNMMNKQIHGFNITFNEVNEKKDYFIVTLRYTALKGGDWGTCDYWEIWEDDYCISKSDGRISLNKRKNLETKTGECY